MARGITEHDVFAAADALLVRGERPTIERVRQELGRGSPNTVNRMLDVWWARLAERLGNKDPGGLPASIVELCRKLYGELQGQAAQEAVRLIAANESQLAAEQRQIEQLRQAYSTEKAALTALAESRRVELQEAQKALQAANTRTAEAEAALKMERKAVVTTTTGLEKQIGARDRRIADLEREIERIRSQWQGNETHWLKVIDHLRGDLKRSQSDLEKQSQGSDRIRADLEKRLAAEFQAHSTIVQKVHTLEAALAAERRDRIQDLRKRTPPNARASAVAKKAIRRKR